MNKPAKSIASIRSTYAVSSDGTWKLTVNRTRRLRRWVVFYRKPTWKKWRIDDSCGCHTRAERQRSLANVVDYATRKRARIVAAVWRDKGYQARTRKAFFELPMEP